ncbi:MAG TPA: tRNA uridine-5-carboxymethylaminomethyl(34) synthesis GTPase MnmE [Kiritimatiellia bacterium]|nr:tRNA uridine-5-carboxymethylaminomethyl(34) synthesis GTPase MnmE [Kiritimatiellia bacterium]HMP97947.1 tRNA uridine-5-carboxymethylaminomethyl(34) synthesis GTPase MnmE [Kiritimatiellia bacterium]
MKTHFNDTIAAMATAPGEAGISIIRISGPDTYRIADHVFAGRGPKPSERPPFTFAHGAICQEGTRLDDVLMLFMRGPRSYTGEDQVEIHGHGGSVVSRRILRCVMEAGARLAEPGEFTRRAFLNGRMDLTQAEAVIDLIKARSERAAQAAVEQLSGSISQSLSTIYDECLSVVADLEATMDFPEDELPEAVMRTVIDRLREVHQRSNDLIATWSEGRLLREGALIVIAGRPNVGKSTLLNALLGQSRAIVSDVPGTTRDTIEEGYVLDGIPLRLVDTAGLRDAACAIEQEGIRRSRDQLEKADGTLYLIDASTGMTQDDHAQLAQLNPQQTLVVWNKMDLCPTTPPPSSGRTECHLSLKDPQAITVIRKKLAEQLSAGYRQGAEQQAVISERHRAILVQFNDHLHQALALVQENRDDHIPLACAHLRDGLEALGAVTGRVYHQELLDHIFSRFCIGK